MPKRSSLDRAYSRHCERTLHAPQTFLASRVEPPFSGKNASGSVWAHSASVCQPSSPSSSKSCWDGSPIQTGCAVVPDVERLELHRRVVGIVVLVRTGQKFVVRCEEGGGLVLQRILGVFVVAVCRVRIGRIYVPVTRHSA